MLGHRIDLGTAAVEVRVTQRPDGDFAVDAPPGELSARRAAVVAGEWTWLRQEHGAGVVVVRHPGDRAGAPADAAVTEVPRAPLAVQTADCAPVVLATPGDGRRPPALAVVHAGWRGLVAGVVPRALAELRRGGDGPVAAVLGPCIEPACYEFGDAELDQVVAVAGPAARAATAAGGTALDLPAAVLAVLESEGVHDVTRLGGCTACAPGWFSHRARGERSRMATVAWLEAA